MGLANLTLKAQEGSRLGFVILDDCSKPGVAAARALAFLGDPRKCTDEHNAGAQTCNPERHPDAIEEYDVVGVIGPMSTLSAIAVNQVLGPASVPVVSFSATGDALNNVTYPFFFSNVLPDSFQLRAIVKLMDYFNWTFVSVVFEDNYKKAFRALKGYLEDSNICLDNFAHISYDESTAKKQKHLRESPWMRAWLDAKGKPEKAFASLPLQIHSDNLLNVVMAYHESISRLLQNCPTQWIRDCVKGPELMEELKRSSMVEHMEKIGFYDVKQVQLQIRQKLKFAVVHLGQINTMTMDVNISNDVKVMFPTAKGSIETKPESLCSIPCHSMEIKMMQHVPCCWICRKCLKGEYPDKNQTECLSCELFTWPEKTQHVIRCLAIPVDRLQAFSPMGGLLVSLTAVQICLLLAVLAVFVRHRQCLALNFHTNFRLFIFMNLVGVGLQQAAVILLLVGAEERTCRAVYWLHGLSAFFIFVPFFMKALARVLLLQVIRRNADSAPEQTVTVYPGARVQVIVLFLLFVLLNLVMTALNIFYDQWVLKTQKSPREKLVEQCCTFPIGFKRYGFLTQLGAMFVLEFIFCGVCSLLIFKSRNLPVGFNDFRFQPAFIATLVITAVCIAPAISVAKLEVTKESLFALILSLDGMGALLFLICPTVYAIFYIPDAVTVCDEDTLTESREEYFSSLRASKSRKEYLSSLQASESSARKEHFSSLRESTRQSLSVDDNTIEGPTPEFSEWRKRGSKIVVD